MFPFSSPSSLAARRWAARRTPRRLAPVLSLALLTAVTLRLSSLALRSPRGRVGNSHEWPNKPLEWPNKPLKEAELSVEGAPFFQHEPARLRLPAAIRIPQTQDGAVSGTCTTGFLMVSFYSEDYTDRARRLQASCSAHAVCCSLSLVPRDAFGTDVPAPELRARLIATKPLFMLAAHVRTGLPIAWVDIDFEVVAFPALFVHGSPSGCDVALFNWQANVSAFHGRRLKMASGVAYFNQTQAARRLLRAWAEAMAYPSNHRAADDQVMDEVVNRGGWRDRADFCWLPASYLFIAGRHRTQGVAPVLEHDRGRPVGRNSRGLRTEPAKLPPSWET